MEILGWVGSVLLVYSVLQTRIFPFATVQCVASALLVIFNAAIAVWPMVALNVTLTAINVFYIVQLLRGRHDSRTFEVVQRDVSAYPLCRSPRLADTWLGQMQNRRLNQRAC